MTVTITSLARPYLQVQSLVKKFGDNYVVNRIDLDIEKHGIFALLGSSGSDKSTLLRMLVGMEIPNQDRIILDGQDITKLAPYDRLISMMLQNYALFPHMTARQDIASGLKQGKMSEDEIAAHVEEMLHLVQVTKYAKRRPHQLSGGQQQRITLAHSLAKRPRVLLLDEPLGASGGKLCQQTQFELVNTLGQVGVTCIVMIHDQEEAMTTAICIVIISGGRLQQIGTPNDVHNFPNSRFTTEFIGETNTSDSMVVEDHADYAAIVCDGLKNYVRIDHGPGGPAKQNLWVSIRPKNIDLYKEKSSHLGDLNWAQGAVKNIAYLGSFVVYHVKLGNGHVIKSQVPAPYWYICNIMPPTWGETVYISWPENQPMPLLRQSTGECRNEFENA